MRRRALVHGAAAAAALALPGAAQAARGDQATDPFRVQIAQARLATIEQQSGGRLGVSILDTATGKRVRHRADERFAMCSTFKLLAAAMVLHRVDAGKDALDRTIAIEQAAILPHSPLTQPQVGSRMTLAALCEAAITQSDNAAANLLLESLGGPAALTAYLRHIGDAITRLDRREPALNEARPGDPRDTTSPNAMLASLHSLLLRGALKPASRTQLQAWLLGNQTGADKLRALLPAGWRIGDKTGGGAFGTHNDVGIVWPPGDRAPLLVTAFLTQTEAPLAQRNATMAAVGALLVELVDGG